MMNNNRSNNFNQNNVEFKYDWNFLKSGYSDNKGILKEEIIREKAIDIAKVLATGTSKFEKISSNQIRAFFNDIKALENRLDTTKSLEEQQKDYESFYPFVIMLEAKAAYKHKNKNDKIPQMFKDFITQNVEVMRKDKSVKTFKNFVKFFEAIVAYFYGFGGDK